MNEPNLEELVDLPVDLEIPGAAALLQESDCAEEDRARIIEWFELAVHILNTYQANQSGEAQLRMSLKCWELALGFTLAAGADGPAELARTCGASKQAVGKCVNHFVSQLRLSPLPGQRTEEGRKHMAEARRAQIGPPKTPQDAPCLSSAVMTFP